MLTNDGTLSLSQISANMEMQWLFITYVIKDLPLSTPHSNSK